ncbi:MAG: NADH-quinone oxidoreductase subunit C [Acidobacteriota bacterium]
MGIEKKSSENPEISLQLMRENHPDGILDTMMPQGDATAIIRPEFLTKIMDFLKNDSRLLFNILMDMTAVDYYGAKPRFELVYHLLSIQFNRRLRVKLKIDEGKTVDSLTPMWGCANWLEREIWDMFGVPFKGHPDLKRILMYEGFEGHPLRKDYPIKKRQPRIKPNN